MVTIAGGHLPGSAAGIFFLTTSRILLPRWDLAPSDVARQRPVASCCSDVQPRRHHHQVGKDIAQCLDTMHLGLMWCPGSPPTALSPAVTMLLILPEMMAPLPLCLSWENL